MKAKWIPRAGAAIFIPNKIEFKTKVIYHLPTGQSPRACFYSHVIAFW